MGYYTGTVLHRSIRNFMVQVRLHVCHVYSPVNDCHAALHCRAEPFHPVQGGDPTGTGQGGESIYGATFPDVRSISYKQATSLNCGTVLQELCMRLQYWISELLLYDTPVSMCSELTRLWSCAGV